MYPVCFVAHVSGRSVESVEALRFGGKRVTIRVLDGLERKVDIEVWPAEVVSMRTLDVDERCDRGVREPRELTERNEERRHRTA